MSEVKKIATRESYGNALVELGAEHDNLIVLDADPVSYTHLDVYKRQCLGRVGCRSTVCGESSKCGAHKKENPRKPEPQTSFFRTKNRNSRAFFPRTIVRTKKIGYNVSIP